MVYAAPEDGGPRRLQVTAPGGIDLRTSPASDAAVVKTLGKGEVLVNFGCGRIDASVWCEVLPLHSRSRGHVTADHIIPAAGPDGTVPAGVDDSLQRARQGDFDASGTVACAQIKDQPMGECSFGVARSGGGDATVAVTFSNGFKRMLFFTHGEFISGDTTMSGTGRDTDWRVVDGRHFIRVDDQRYELPDGAIFGN